MNAAARSLVVFGAYLLINAFSLTFAPNAMLGLFGLPSTNEPWLRVLGLVVGAIGYYYIFAAHHRLSAFYPATVWGRGMTSLAFLGLVVTGTGPWQLLIFGALDLLSALWTHRSLKRTEA
jgi:hypothetical protein